MNDVRILERELALLSRQYLKSRDRNLRLERSAYLILSRLEAEGPLTIKGMARAFGLDLSTVNRQIAALQRAGHAEPCLDPAGGTARRFRPSAEGLRQLNADRFHYEAGVKRTIGSWERADVEQFAELLMRFNVAIEDLEGRHWPRPDLDDPTDPTTMTKDKDSHAPRT
ncbi:MarR family winged helix-turn-helix transcriptional regulator [Arthrobacter dokdonensis]|uniref:MarR family winged helix-turn-helix transcriptional regulator n=1 Tax=Arthrobacter dokdonellae TaxID=2211210 RepID=UPI001D131568|nr:MarR family winged helix-turn-helix transcriptional regulator [Arthrobacter dokdonellae]